MIIIIVDLSCVLLGILSCCARLTQIFERREGGGMEVVVGMAGYIKNYIDIILRISFDIAPSHRHLTILSTFCEIILQMIIQSFWPIC